MRNCVSYRFVFIRRCAISATFAALLLLHVTACPPKKFKGQDAEMMGAAKRIAGLVNEYFRDIAEYPETIAQLRPLLPPGVPWPQNPYRGGDVIDTRNREFDPEKSPGNIYYEKIFRDEQMVNYQIHVFGEKGKLYIIGNTAVGPKE